MKDHGGSAAAAKVNTERRLKGMVYGRWNGELLEDQDHGFRAGDLVWAKMKGQPWWPGQVYDPRDASELCLRHSREGCVLVFFFGDGSCSWCLPLQLVPLVENLERMWSERRSSSSEKAVHMAFDEIGRLMESRISCRCISLEKRGDLARPMAKNDGVKAGLLVPEVDIDHLPIPRYEPADIRAKLVGFASTASFDSVLHLTVLRSRISAYSYAECGGRRLATYSEPILIDYSEKLDDEMASEKDKMTSLASDVEVEVNELMLRLKSAAVDHSHMRNEGHFDSLCRFASAYRGSTYFKKVSRKRKKLTCNPKVLRSTASADEQTDSLVLDARVIKKKINSMTKMLESCGSKISSDDKARLGEEMKCIMEKLVTVSDKVRSMAKKRAPLE